MFNFLKLVLVIVLVLEIFCFVLYRERNIVHLSTISDENGMWMNFDKVGEKFHFKLQRNDANLLVQ